MTNLSLIFPPHAYAAWVGESDENTATDEAKIKSDPLIKNNFSDLVANAVAFAKTVLYCPHCGQKIDYQHFSRKKNYSY